MNIHFPIGIDCYNVLHFDHAQVPLETAKRFYQLQKSRVRIWFEQTHINGLEACDFECITKEKAKELIELLKNQNKLLHRPGSKVRKTWVITARPILPYENKWLAQLILKPDTRTALMVDEAEFACAYANLDEKNMILGSFAQCIAINDESPFSFSVPQINRIKAALLN